jgi:hypothetical protein
MIRLIIIIAAIFIGVITDNLYLEAFALIASAVWYVCIITQNHEEEVDVAQRV